MFFRQNSSSTKNLSQNPRQLDTFTNRIIDFLLADHKNPTTIPQPLSGEMSCEKAALILSSEPHRPTALAADHFTASRLPTCTAEETLHFVTGLLRYFRENLHRSFSFPILLQVVPRLAQSSSPLDSKQIAMLSFICGLRGTSSQSDSRRGLTSLLLRLKHEPSLLDRMSFTELSIICNSLHSTGTRWPTCRMMDQAAGKLEEELRLRGVTIETLPVIKVLRSSGRPCPATLLQSLAHRLCTPADLNLTQAAHALALLAEQHWSADYELLQGAGTVLEASLVPAHRTPAAARRFLHPAQGARLKDVSRFAWSVTCLAPAGLQLQMAELIVQESLRYCLRQLEHEEKLLLIDILLSLACWSFYSGELTAAVAEQWPAPETPGAELRLRRAELFISAASVERPDLLPEKLRRLESPLLESLAPVSDLRRRPLLARVLRSVRQAERPWLRVRATHPIRGLDLAGVQFIDSGAR